MVTAEKQLEKLQQLQELLNKDHPTSEEVMKLFEVVLKAVIQIKKELTDSIDVSKGEAANKTDSAVKNIDGLLSKVYYRLNTLDTKNENLDNTIADITREFYAEILRVEKLIPIVPSQLPLENQMNALKKLINEKAPKPLTAVQIRDELDGLEGLDRFIPVSSTPPENPVQDQLWIDNS